MSSFNMEECNITPLKTKDGYRIWRIFVRAILTANRVLDYTQSDGSAHIARQVNWKLGNPLFNSDTIVYPEVKAILERHFKSEWDRGSKKAAKLIVSTLDDAVKAELVVQDLNDGFKVMERIRDLFESPTSTYVPLKPNAPDDVESVMKSSDASDAELSEMMRSASFAAQNGENSTAQGSADVAVRRQRSCTQSGSAGLNFHSDEAASGSQPGKRLETEALVAMIRMKVLTAQASEYSDDIDSKDAYKGLRGKPEQVNASNPTHESVAEITHSPPAPPNT